MTGEQDLARNPAGGSPLVTIVLCTYNGSRFLAEQLDSLLAQTWPDIEIVVVDDASTDATLELLHQYARRDGRIRITANPVNLGFARNFESALPLARGEFIAPSDQDDVWLPDKITALVAAIGQCPMAFCDSTFVDERGRDLGYRMSEVLPLQRLDDPLPFAFGNCVSGHALLFRRSLLQRALPVPEGFFHDWWLATVAAATGGVVYLDRSLVRYRQHGANITETRMAEMVAEAGLAPDADEGAKGSVASHREQGSKLRYCREMEQRLAAIKELPGRHQPFAVELWRLWRQRESQWISLALWRVVTSNQERLLSLTRMSGRKRARYCADLFWGGRAKRLTAHRDWLP